jgi:hypothetical protein
MALKRPRRARTVAFSSPTPEPASIDTLPAWEKQALSARGFKRVGRHSEYAR